MKDDKENLNGNNDNKINSVSNWDYFFENIEVSDDFMNERNQPMPQERERIFE